MALGRKKNGTMLFDWVDYTAKDAALVDGWLDETAVAMTGLDEGWDRYWQAVIADAVNYPGCKDCCKIVWKDGTPVAAIVFGCYQGNGTVSEIVVAPAMRGKGLGSQIIRELVSCADSWFEEKVAQFDAIVFRGNAASRRAFQKAGFVPDNDPEGLRYVYRKKMDIRAIILDLDGTLLRDDKSMSARTLAALRRCREKGILVAVSTSRAEQNCLAFLPELTPDLVITSGGAAVKLRGEYVYTAEFTEGETRSMILAAREVCGADCEMTVDTLDAHYWNYKVDPNKADATWGETIFTDFQDFSQKALKFCVQIFDDAAAAQLARLLPECDCHRFSDSHWYKFTKKDVTKEHAIRKACQLCGISLEHVAAFGDDGPDIGMLELCGVGVAMGNAIESVKAAADFVCGSNQEDGVAGWLEEWVLG